MTFFLGDTIRYVQLIPASHDLLYWAYWLRDARWLLLACDLCGDTIGSSDEL